MKKGSRFEELVKNSCELQGIHCKRLKDGNSRTGPDGRIVRLKTSNPADFYVYTGKTFAYVECKSYDKRIPFNDLRQLSLQLEIVNQYDYIKAGFVIEFKSTGNCYWIDCKGIVYMQSIIGKKSFNEGDMIRLQPVTKAKGINMYKPPRKRLNRLDMMFIEKI